MKKYVRNFSKLREQPPPPQIIKENIRKELGILGLSVAHMVYTKLMAMDVPGTAVERMRSLPVAERIKLLHVCPDDELFLDPPTGNISVESLNIEF